MMHLCHVHVLIVYRGVIPVKFYGGTQRDIWYEGRELVKMGHKVSYLVKSGSECDFGRIIEFDPEKDIRQQIPEDIDIVHYHDEHPNMDAIDKPYLFTLHGNKNTQEKLPVNTVFISKNHASRFGSEHWVFNGMDWDDYGEVDWNVKRDYFHFLGNAAWRLKNVKGAIRTVTKAPGERIDILGGVRFNFEMGIRLTWSPRARFHGMVGGNQKYQLINGSKGLIFPVRWNEPMGLAIIESLYFGCPVFGTPYGSLPEMVTPEFGFLSNRRSELTEAIKNVDSYDRKRCHEYARETYSSKVMTDHYVRYFEQILNGQPVQDFQPSLKEVQQDKFLPWFD